MTPYTDFKPIDAAEVAAATNDDLEQHRAVHKAFAAQQEREKIEHREFMRRELERNLEFFIRDDTAKPAQRSRALLLLRYVQAERSKLLEARIGR